MYITSVLNIQIWVASRIPLSKNILNEIPPKKSKSIINRYANLSSNNINIGSKTNGKFID